MTDRTLINIAMEAAKKSYSPYSRFPVGAALECNNGKVYTGCNIENVALGCTVCAEQVAVFKAVSEGETKFKRLAVYAGSGSNYCFPCGTCRQVMLEFSPHIEVLCAKADGRYVSYMLNELLPASFNKDIINS